MPQDEIFQAIRQGSLSDLRKVLYDPSVRSAINARDEAGRVALVNTSTIGQYAMAEALIEAGADIRRENSEGINAFDMAANKGRIDFMELLVKHGYLIHEVGSKDITALMYAVIGNNRDSVAWLLSRGARPELKTSHGVSALSLAQEVDNPEILSLLLQTIADITEDGLADDVAVSTNTRPNVEVEGHRVTMRSNLSGDEFETSSGKLLTIATIDGSFVALDETTGRFMEVYGGMPLSDFMRLAIQTGIKPVLLEDNLFHIGNLPKGRYAFRDKKLLGFVVGESASAKVDIAPKTPPSASEEFRFSGDIMSLISGAPSKPVIGEDAAIFEKPPLTTGANFLRSAPGGLSQVFTGTLLAFEEDIAEVLVKNAIGDTDVTIRCQVSIETRGIDYEFDSIATKAEELRRSYFTKEDLYSASAISSDTVREHINKRVSIGPAGEVCGHFELLD